MPGGVLYLAFAIAERLAHKVGVLDSHIEKRLLPCGEIVGHGSLIKVAAVVELMAVDFFPAVSAPPSRKALALVGDTSGEIAVRLLGSSNEIDHTVEIVVELGVILHGERIRGALDNLIRVGVVKRKITLVLAFHQSAGNGKIVKAPVFFTFFEC